MNFKQFILCNTSVVALSIPSLAAPATLLDGFYLANIPEIISVESVDFVLTPQGHQHKTYEVKHPNGKPELIPGYGSDRCDIYSLLLRNVHFKAKIEGTQNIIIPNVMIQEDHEQRMKFFQNLFQRSFPTKNPFKAMSDNLTKGRRLWNWTHSEVIEGKMTDLVILTNEKGNPQSLPLVAFSGDSKDAEILVWTGLAFYLEMTVLDSSTEKVKLPKSTLSGMRATTENRIFIGGLVRTPYADKPLNKKIKQRIKS